MSASSQLVAAAEAALAFFEVNDDDDAVRVAGMLRDALQGAEAERPVRIDAKTPLWVVTDATKHSDLGDICFETTLEGLRLQFAGGLSMDDHPVLFTDEAEAHEEGKTRLFVHRVAERIRVERRLAADEVVRVTLHSEDGRVLWEGEVQ